MSKTLRLSTAHDSDSDSDFSNPLDEEERKEESKLPQGGEDEDCPWRSAVDPSSGKTYYYHIKTRETQWRKPLEMASREEKEALAAKERRQKDFFAAMEANILQSIAQGFKVPEKKNRLDFEFENKEISKDPLAISTSSNTATNAQTQRPQLSPQRSRQRVSTNSSSRSIARERTRPNLVRTISSMDSAFLSELIQRVPSSRQVVRTGRQASTRSIGMGIGSSNHSRQGRFQQRNQSNRGLAPVAPAKTGAGQPYAAESKSNDDDDDDLPPLTVVTSPDLRKRDSLGLDALATSIDPRDNLVRRDSLTLDQLSFHGGGGNLMDSRFFDQSAGSRLTMSNNSFQLEPDSSHHSGSGSGYLGHFGGSFNKSSAPALINNCSFNSFDSSIRSLDASQNGGMSVVSNPLHPVHEVMDESELSNPRLDVGSAVLEYDNEDDESPEETSFSLGGDGDFQEETTANWLDALPPEEGANDDEELVGYGNNAKPFSDAGFTSFFDESMANFDLSDKETQALQKLAFISEQMTKVAEAEESDEADDDDDDDSDADPLNPDDKPEYPLFFMESEDEGGTEDDPSSEENEGYLSPSYRTPTTSSTAKTTGTASTRELSHSPLSSPPQRAPARRTLGPQNTRAQRNLLRDDSVEDEDTPLSTANLPTNLALASATLTIDNARSHQTNHFNELSSKPGRQQSRRHTAGHVTATGDWSPKRGEDDRPVLEKDSNSTSSLNSQSSIAMANAARRLSMFRLKNSHQIKLKSTGGKGGLAQQLAASSSDLDPKDLIPAPEIKGSCTASDADREQAGRPNLVRRNTCGTLYVGTTMSAPDKDATIKCVCGVFRAHILQSEMEDEGADNPNFRIFNDLESQQHTARRKDFSRRNNNNNNSSLPVPSLQQITTFYRDVFQRAQMEYDCIIISLIYVERLIKTTMGALRPRACNWRSILFSCMVLASKVWDDLSMWNADFSQTCPNGVKFPLKRINELEVAILSALSYKVKVPASEYAKYYFLLRSMLIKSGLVGDDVDTTTPLDLEGAKRLQQVSTRFQSGMGETRRQMRKAKSMRSKSMGEGKFKAAAGVRGAREKNKVSLEHVVKM